MCAFLRITKLKFFSKFSEAPRLCTCAGPVLGVTLETWFSVQEGSRRHVTGQGDPGAVQPLLRATRLCCLAYLRVPRSMGFRREPILSDCILGTDGHRTEAS